MIFLKNLRLKIMRYFYCLGFTVLFCLFLLSCYSLPQTFPSSDLNKEQNLKNSKTNNENVISNDTSLKDPTFENNKRLWNEKNVINYNLTMSIKVTSFTGPSSPVSIQVRDGKSVSIQAVEKNDNRSIEIYREWDTIDKLFDLIKSESEKDSKIKTSYNKNLGYPEEILLLPKGSNAITDIKIIKFEKL
jgi:hypothetical protein